MLQDGWTALIHAADNGHTDTAAELVRLGADINAQDNVWARGRGGLSFLTARDRNF
jgi:ankyrin repeat protein